MLINPPDDLKLQKGDELLVLAEDDESYRAAEAVSVEHVAPPKWQPPARQPENLLICGWNREVPTLIHELDAYVAHGSRLTVLSTMSADERVLAIGAMKGELKNLEVVQMIGDPAQRGDLVEVGAHRFDGVIVLATGSSEASSEELDAEALICLLNIRDLRSKHRPTTATMISEISDPRTKHLVSLAGVSDYVVSSEIISKLLAQVSERQDIARVWQDLLDSEGNEIYLKDARCYVTEGESVSFWQLMGRARARSEIALGYLAAGTAAPVLNPKDKAAVRKFAPGDRVVVISENGD
jgi:hypothetical protein